jgi:hypothetical protein
MKRLIKTRWLLGLAVCLSTTAFADTVSMTLTGVGSNGGVAGIAVGPYLATIGTTQNVKVICDDFLSETWLWETWKATVNSVADLGSSGVLASTKWGSQGATQAQYNEAAWLAMNLVMANSADAAAIQFAIWEVFLPEPGTTPFDLLSASQLNLAQSWLDAAKAHASDAASSFADVFIFTPIAGTAVGCPGGCGLSTPQEFLVVRTPEPAAAALLAVDFTGVVGLVLFFRRKRRS